MEPVHFLLVDDLEENLLALEALLRRDNLVLLKATSGAQALELLLNNDIALALIDVQMPEMDGFELAELMRGTERTKTIPIIFLTAGTDDKQRRFRGYEAGAVDFMHKPIEVDILTSKADVFYELFRQRQEVASQRDQLKIATADNALLLEEAQQYAAALKEADARKDEFLATLAHELRNPLAPIRSGLQILRKDPNSESAEEIRDMMNRQLNHMVRLIDDLLDMSRVSQGKIELRKETSQIQNIVQSALEVSTPIIEEKNHAITITMPEEPIWIEADITRMAQVLSNLLNNSAKYTHSGGKIDLAITSDKQQVSIAISDNGTGLEPAMLNAVFDLFTQVENNHQQSQGGLGIGLALAKYLVELHHGTIEAKSEGLGKGSTFSIHMPLAKEHQQTQSSESNESSEITNKLQVLVVDDNVESAKTLGWMLELIGHDYTLAHTGKSALEKAEEISPHAILLDIGLPDMTGYDVCRTLRDNAAFKHTTLIAQTGWGQKRDKELAEEAGFAHHLIKPVDWDELAAILAKVNPQASA